MRTKIIISVGAALLLLFVTTLSFAQPWQGWRGSGGWGMNSNYQRLYDPKTVETVSGTVESVNKVTPTKGMYYGIHVNLKTNEGLFDVHLGPGWYIERLDLKIVPGDHLEVSGSKIMFQGKPAIIAAEVKKGDQILRLRDDNGFPLWAGWRRQ